MIERRCVRCGETKTIKSFYGMRDTPVCRSCVSVERQKIKEDEKARKQAIKHCRACKRDRSILYFKTKLNVHCIPCQNKRDRNKVYSAKKRKDRLAMKEVEKVKPVVVKFVPAVMDFSGKPYRDGVKS